MKEGVKLNKIQDGGHQERDKRAGTENVAGIVGLGKAINIAYKNIDNYNKKLLDLREYYISEVEKKIPDICINGDRTNRLPGNANISFKGVDREFPSFKIRRSAVFVYQQALPAIQKWQALHMYCLQYGTPREYINGSIRATFGEQNTKEDIEFLLNHLERCVKELR